MQKGKFRRRLRRPSSLLNIIGKVARTQAGRPGMTQSDPHAREPRPSAGQGIRLVQHRSGDLKPLDAAKLDILVLDIHPHLGIDVA